MRGETAASGREAWGRACKKMQGHIPAWVTTPGKAAALGDSCPSVEGGPGALCPHAGRRGWKRDVFCT